MSRVVESAGKIKVTSDLKAELLEFFSQMQEYYFATNLATFHPSLPEESKQDFVILASSITDVAYRCSGGDADNMFQYQVLLAEGLEVMGEADFHVESSS